MDGIGRINKIKAKNFYDGITAMPYEYGNKTLAETIKNIRDAKGEATFDALIAQAAEVMGRALQAEMKKTGKALSQQMYNSVKQKFLKFDSQDKLYIDASDALLHAGDKAILKFLMATWKYGDELGLAVGLEKQDVAKVKKDVADIYMPQEDNGISQVPRLGSGMSV